MPVVSRDGPGHAPQRITIDLAGRRQRYRRHDGPQCGDHEAGQPLGEKAGQLGDRRAVAGRNAGGHQLPGGAVPRDGDEGLCHPRMARQDAAHLAELDAAALDLHLVVAPPEELEPTLGVQADDVTRPVHPGRDVR